MCTQIHKLLLYFQPVSNWTLILYLISISKRFHQHSYASNYNIFFISHIDVPNSDSSVINLYCINVFFDYTSSIDI